MALPDYLKNVPAFKPNAELVEGVSVGLTPQKLLRVMIGDHSQYVYDSLSQVSEFGGYHIEYFHAYTGHMVLDSIPAFKPDILILDFFIPSQMPAKTSAIPIMKEMFLISPDTMAFLFVPSPSVKQYANAEGINNVILKEGENPIDILEYNKILSSKINPGYENNDFLPIPKQHNFIPVSNTTEEPEFSPEIKEPPSSIDFEEQYEDDIIALKQDLRDFSFSPIADQRKNGKVIVLAGVSGVGKNIIASTLAAMAANNQNKKSLIIEFDLCSADAYFKHQKEFRPLPEHIRDGFDSSLKSFDAATMENMIWGTNLEGVSVISGYALPYEAESIGAEHVAAILKEVTGKYDFIFIKTSHYHKTDEIIFEHADLILEITQCDTIRVRNTFNYLSNIFKTSPELAAKTKVIINKSPDHRNKFALKAETTLNRLVPNLTLGFISHDSKTSAMCMEQRKTADKNSPFLSDLVKIAQKIGISVQTETFIDEELNENLPQEASGEKKRSFWNNMKQKFSKERK